VVQVPFLSPGARKSKTSPKYAGKELSKELRAALLERFVSGYKLQVKQVKQKITQKDDFRDGFHKEQNIDFYVDVQPEHWRLRWFDFDESRYYYEYVATLRIINGTQGGVLGELECRYQSAENRAVEYDSDVRDYIYSQADLDFFHKQPVFEDWFAEKGRLLQEHTQKAAQTCLEKFEEKVMGRPQ